MPKEEKSYSCLVEFDFERESGPKFRIASSWLFNTTSIFTAELSDIFYSMFPEPAPFKKNVIIMADSMSVLFKL